MTAHALVQRESNSDFPEPELLMCTRCGKVVDVDADLPATAAEALADYGPCTGEQMILKLNDVGDCPSCHGVATMEELFHLGECMQCFLRGVGAIE
jgi:Fe2+ or Zn2+ uptake regulation protein